MHKIQMSVYHFGNPMEEKVYEAEVSSIQEFIALSYMNDKKIKYKKATDKTWYTPKALAKRVFKKEFEELSNIEVKYVKSNDLDAIFKEKYLKSQERERRWIIRNGFDPNDHTYHD